jgi:hypothetical protein
MKNLVTCLAVLVSFSALSQTIILEREPEAEVKIESVDFVVTVDSAEELDSTFKIEDLKTLFEESNDNETISLKIVCNDELMSNGKKSSFSYKIDGNAKNMNEFMKSARKIKRAAIKYYKDKK